MIRHLFLILLCLIPSYASAQVDKNITLKISPTNMKELSGTDDVNIKLEIINNGNISINLYCWKGVTITQAINTFLNFKIINGNDTLVYNYIGPKIKLPYKNDFKAIEPGSSFVELIDLNKYYISAKDKDNTSRNWAKGTYVIECTYEYKHDKDYRYGDELWEGRLVSNKIELEIQ